MRNPKTWRRLAPTLVLGLVAGLAACGQDEKPGKTASGNEMCPPNEQPATPEHPDTKLAGTVTIEGWDDGWKKTFGDFEKAYPNVHMKYQTSDQPTRT